MGIVTKYLHIWHNGEDVMVHLAPLADTQGSYKGHTYRIKGDDRVELTRDSDGSTTMHNNVTNALAWADDVVYGPEPEPGFEPTLDAIDPVEAEISGADVTLTCTGTNFTETSVIVFNGGPEPTTFVSDTELTTIVRPSTASVAGDFPVLVQQGSFQTAPVDFTFTEPVTP